MQMIGQPNERSLLIMVILNPSEGIRFLLEYFHDQLEKPVMPILSV